MSLPMPLVLLLLLPSSSCNGFTSPYSPKPKQRRYKYDNLILSSYGNNNASNSREELRYQELVEYKDEHGDTLVPAKYPANLQLGRWVLAQRQNRKKNKLTPGRVDRLIEIGFVWDPLENSWNEMLQQIVDYKEEHGDTLVPAKYPDKQQLGIWVDTQRQNRKNKKMSPERVNKLNDIGFVWDVLEAAWEDMLQQLKQYKNNHCDTLVPQGYKVNPKLGKWVQWQRVQYNRRQTRQISHMTDERVGKLNEIDFVWDANEWCMRQRYSKSPRQRYDQLKKVNFDFFTRKISKGSSLIENMIIYELERMGHEFDMLNKVFFNVKNGYRPDGVMFIDEAFVIFFEVDENYHGDSRYPIKKELGRMVALRREAVAQGYDQVTFVRIGTGRQRKIVGSQLEFVSTHLHELKSNVQPNRSSVHYIDYPDDHHHVIASKEHFGEVKVLTSK